MDYLSSVSERYTRENFKRSGLSPTPQLIKASIDRHVKIATRNYIDQLEESVKIEAIHKIKKEEWGKYTHCRKIVMRCVVWEIGNIFLLIFHRGDKNLLWINFHLIIAIAMIIAFAIMIKPFIIMIFIDLSAAKRKIYD